jgi:hypothetical protein
MLKKRERGRRGEAAPEEEARTIRHRRCTRGARLIGRYDNEGVIVIIQLCPACVPLVIKEAVKAGVDVLSTDELMWFARRMLEAPTPAMAAQQRDAGITRELMITPTQNEGIYCGFHRALGNRRREERMNDGPQSVYVPAGVQG